MSARPILTRMAEAKAKMVNARRQTPRVFYLSPADYAEFAETEPPTVEAIFALPLGHKPVPMTCLGFEGLAVRQSLAKPDARGRVLSKLISCAATSIAVRPE